MALVVNTTVVVSIRPANYEAGEDCYAGRCFGARAGDPVAVDGAGIGGKLVRMMGFPWAGRRARKETP